MIEHLYKPKQANELKDHDDLLELAILTDMLGMSSLLDLVCSTMVSELCHNFHKVMFHLPYSELTRHSNPIDGYQIN